MTKDSPAATAPVEPTDPPQGTVHGAEAYPHPLEQSAQRLAGFGLWDEAVYRDFLAVQAGTLSREAFEARYVHRVAILCLDMTQMTESAIREGALGCLLRILDVQKVTVPVFEAHEARLIRMFADDVTVLFDTAAAALDAALEVHRRVAAFNRSPHASAHPAECCIGIGYGDVYAIGPNAAMGDEMNRASKLGEDTARGGETLLTEQARTAVGERADCTFERRTHTELPFPYFAAHARD